MQTGALTSQLDVAQLALIVFFLFFVGLVRYLQRESNREGFPLVDPVSGATLRSPGLSGLPDPKTFLLSHGGTVVAPRPEVEAPPANATAARFPGGPIEPVGHPLLSGVGPAAYTDRPDVADLEYFSGEPRIVPLHAAPGYSLAAEDPDPRGMPVVGADGATGGTVSEVWIDKTETMIRYLQVATNGGRSVLLPAPLADVQGEKGRVHVTAITGAQFEDVPATKSPDQVTLLEEDKIRAYFGGGVLYATPARVEPLI